MPKDTKTLGNNKARACESLGFVHKKDCARVLTHLRKIKVYKRLFNRSYRISLRLCIAPFSPFWFTKCHLSSITC